MALTVAVIVGFAILPYSTASVGAALACVIALFALSVYKPDKKKAKAKPEKTKAERQTTRKRIEFAAKGGSSSRT